MKVGEDKLGMEESLLKVWEVWEETLVWESPRRCSEAFQDFVHKLQPVAISIEGLRLGALGSTGPTGPRGPTGPVFLSTGQLPDLDKNDDR